MAEGRKYTRKKNVIRARAIPMLSVKRISEKYGFHANTVYAWVTRDRLRHVRHGPGRKIFIRQDDVEAFIQQWYED